MHKYLRWQSGLSHFYKREHKSPLCSTMFYCVSWPGCNTLCGLFSHLGLLEVYRVSKRMEDGVKARQLASELLQHALREVDLAWNNLLSFLVFGHPMFQMLVRHSSL